MKSVKRSRYRTDKNSKKFWTSAVTLTLNIAIQSFHKTIWLIMMYHQTKFGCKRLCSSEVSLVGAATSIIFVATNTCLLWQNTSFVTTKIYLLQQTFCHKQATKVMSWQAYFCHNKHTFCCNKHNFVGAKDTTKLILVAAPVNDREDAAEWETAIFWLYS